MEKSDIIKALRQGRDDFLKVIEGLSEEQVQAPGVVGEWSVKDILTHLSLWEAEVIRMLWQLKRGEKPEYLNLSTVDVDRLNARWFAENRNRPLERVLADFHAVRKQLIRQVEGYSDKELNEPQRFPALGGKPLEEWIAEDSYRHEAEHAGQIRLWRGVAS